MNTFTLRKEDQVKRNVLIVDDEMINRELLGMIVGERYDVLYAENGCEALEVIRENRTRLSLILLDILMPELDGFGVLTELKNDEELRRIPVIVLTSEKTAEVKSLQYGAVDFIPKPYEAPDVILARIDRSIELAEDKGIIRETETDPLTGLYITEFFLQYAKQRDLITEKKPSDAVVLSINRLRIINELQGWHVGDRVLKAVANEIHAFIEKVGGIACRAGGDQFYLYFAHDDHLAERMEELIEAICRSDETGKISVRIGIYPNADHSIDLKGRFDRARQAADTLEKTFLSGVALYDEKMYERELFEARLLHEVDRAIDENQFRVFFQPKYDIRGEKPVLGGAEALIRWFHPELGLISPGIFIPLLEKNGMTLKIDRFVWNETARQIAAWQKQYAKTVPVSVNVSRIDMYDPNLTEEIQGIAKKNGICPADLHLEITESAYVEDSGPIVDFAKKMRDGGFVVEMDDFGSGYSSLNTLSTIPMDVLKLDMKFVRSIVGNERDYLMVKLMIDIAKNLSLTSIAEGVETADQLKLLKDVGCDLVQGYYFSKPMPAEEFARFLEEANATPSGKD